MPRSSALAVASTGAPMGSGYFRKVLNSGPIAYWPQWERSGGVAQCLVRRVQDGAYTGVTLGQPGIGDGNVCPFYDGLNDYTDIYSATLAAAFNGSEGTVMIWARVANAGVWTDGAGRRAFTIRADVNNRLYIASTAANNQLQYVYEAGGVVESVVLNGVAELDWMRLALSWSKNANEVRAYYNGEQTGAIQVGLGVWAGVLDNTRTLIGASVTTPANVWHGNLAHGAIWDTPLTPATIAELSRV